MKTPSPHALRLSAVDVAIFLCLSLYSGCAPTAVDPNEPTLSFDAPAHDEGLVRGRLDRQDTIEHVFNFQAWDHSPVRIVSVATSCSCMAAVGAKDMPELAPGATGTLTIHLDPSGRVGPLNGRAVVETDPPSPTPLLLTMNAIMMIEPFMVPGSATIRTAQKSGIPLSLTATYLRKQEEASLRLDKKASDLGPFALVDEQYLHEQRVDRSQGGAYLSVDRVLIQLKTRQALPLGTHDCTLRLAWEGLDTPSKVPVSVRVEPPVSLTVASLFFGTLKPNERVEIRIPLQRSEAVVAAALEVRSDLEYVQAEVGKSANELRVSLRAPEKEGRFSGVIRIRLVSPDAKSGLDDVVELPVSGIVEQGAP